MELKDLLQKHPNLSISTAQTSYPTWRLRWHDMRDQWLVYDDHSTPIVKPFADIDDALAFLLEKVSA